MKKTCSWVKCASLFVLILTVAARPEPHRHHNFNECDSNVPPGRNPDCHRRHHGLFRFFHHGRHYPPPSHNHHHNQFCNHDGPGTDESSSEEIGDDINKHGNAGEGKPKYFNNNAHDGGLHMNFGGNFGRYPPTIPNHPIDTRPFNQLPFGVNNQFPGGSFHPPPFPPSNGFFNGQGGLNPSFPNPGNFPFPIAPNLPNFDVNNNYPQNRPNGNYPNENGYFPNLPNIGASTQLPVLDASNKLNGNDETTRAIPNEPKPNTPLNNNSNQYGGENQPPTQMTGTTDNYSNIGFNSMNTLKPTTDSNIYISSTNDPMHSIGWLQNSTNTVQNSNTLTNPYNGINQTGSTGADTNSFTPNAINSNGYDVVPTSNNNSATNNNQSTGDKSKATPQDNGLDYDIDVRFGDDTDNRRNQAANMSTVDTAKTV